MNSKFIAAVAVAVAFTMPAMAAMTHANTALHASTMHSTHGQIVRDTAHSTHGAMTSSHGGSKVKTH